MKPWQRAAAEKLEKMHDLVSDALRELRDWPEDAVQVSVLDHTHLRATRSYVEELLNG